MTFQLRSYQQNAVDETTKHIMKCFDPCLLELATGAGKSLIVAEIAEFIRKKSNKKVLCLAPSKELIEQNREKYLSYGQPASIFSASLKSKCLKNQVIFGSPQTIVKSLGGFGPQFGAVIIDEAHGITPTIKKIIESMRDHNPKLRIIGLTATPYRTGTGYIYEIDENGKPVPGGQTRDPYFKKLLCRVTAESLIDQGYLTQPVADVMDGYDTGGLELSSTNKFTSESVEQAFEGHGRKTAEIVCQIVELSRNRKGVMIFAATIQHAIEIMASLPKDNSALVVGGTKAKDRDSIINQFKAQKIKYLVNVAVLTTGFDAPHVDVVAILRATESPGLLQQIIGRGLRLYDGKADCLVLDYAENIERHGLEDNPFDPDVKAYAAKDGGFTITAICQSCGLENEFSGRPNPEEFEVNEAGYFVDLAGNEIMVDDQPMPAHHGRRCTNQVLEAGHFERCNGRWSFKVCPECDAENDIAARYCTECKAELVDPNTSLVLQFKRMKSSPHIASSDKVLTWFAQPWTSRAGNETLRIDWTTEYRRFSAWYSPNSKTSSGQALWADLSMAVFNGRVAPTIDKFMSALKASKGTMPATITSKKEGDFFKVIAHNRPEDILGG